MSAPTTDYDVIVIGGGNAGFSAAHAAAERGRRVVVFERGTAEMAGGNSFFTAGATRIEHAGLSDIVDFIEPDKRHQRTEVPPYSAEEYLYDLNKVTEGRTDPELARVLVTEAQGTVRWLHSLGLRYRLMYERQAYRRADGSYLFWGGLHVGNVDGGEGLIADHTRAAAMLGTEVRYGARATDLVVEDGQVVGVEVDDGSGSQEFHADSVILASGGFESNPEWREKYLGHGWRNAKVRGTPYNTGDMIAAALAIGAARGGDWSTAHSVQWDAYTPNNESNRRLTNRLTRQSYPLGIIVNREGRR
ncbi:MAG TPA: FAD-dependent oxidoreductase, partial [Mycobacterium sp.]|nr:FAD-dependent oxidoreductase [Mycobacterium sp.]